MVTVKFTESDYLEAIALHGRWGVKSWLFYVAGPSALILLALLLIFFSSGLRIIGIYWIGLEVFCLSAILVTKFLLTPIAARRSFRKRSVFQRQHVLWWDESSFCMKSEGSESRIQWSDFLRWRENQHIILLYTSPRLFTMVPIRIFGDTSDLDGFHRLLRDQIGPVNVMRKMTKTAASIGTVN